MTTMMIFSTRRG